MTARPSPTRKASNLSIDSKLMQQARALDVNVSRAAEAGIAAAVAAERERLWKMENKAALDAWSDWAEKSGLPLSRHRGF